MQNINTFNTIGLSLELFHVQTNTSFDFPLNLAVIRIGKPNDQSPPDIDISHLPDNEVVSRIHTQIRVEGSNYFIEDLGSSNGTFLNNVKLEPRTSYQLNFGDKIDLDQGNKVTFIFQYQQQSLQNFISTSNSTSIQPQIAKNKEQIALDRTTKIIGLALMIVGAVTLTANIRVGIFFRIPGILLCCTGVFMLFQRRVNPNLGWVLIGLGIAVILFTGNVFASVNLLVLLTSFVLFLVGYLLFATGKILDYDLRSLKRLIKK
ncbi:phosphopeptide-binding protein [Nostoc minutum NIES-26]|uniref:Phosphopeptide-binding protein n=1 Tax=Nostoc minutum NIES-26 TaxID=1844469 RepID=A0A367RH07_9NOSO|nr:phosphopeptide-binding protein [Nostoc minutum NIES-26]